MVTLTEPHSNIDNTTNNPQPAPLAWKEFRRRSGIIHHGPRIYTYTTPVIFPTPTPPSTPISDSTQYVSLVTQALQELGSSTGGNIAAWIAKTFDIPPDKVNSRRLHYIVNAILSSPKYRHLFLKDQILKDEKRILWRLRTPDDVDGLGSPIAPSAVFLAPSIPLSPLHIPTPTSTLALEKVLPQGNPDNPSIKSPLTPISSPTAGPLEGTTTPFSARRRKRKDSEDPMEVKKVKVTSIIE